MPRLRETPLADNTIRTYEARRDRLGLDGCSPEEIVERFRDFLAERPPIGTALPTRAAALRAILDAVPGMSQRDAEELLPSVSGLKAHRMRFALSPEQLDAYYADVWNMPEGGVRTALYLLPQTGMRTAEMCTMPRARVRPNGKGYDFEVHGKSQTPRKIRVLRTGAEMLRQYMATLPAAGEWLFPAVLADGPMREQVLQHAVAGYVNRKKSYPGVAQRIDVPDITPYVLRHTFATSLLNRRVALPTIARVMGHESIRTTEEYLHIADADADAAFDLAAR